MILLQILVNVVWVRSVLNLFNLPCQITPQVIIGHIFFLVQYSIASLTWILLSRIEILLKETRFIVRDLLIFELPIMLDSFHSFVDVFLCKELAEVFELLFYLLLPCIVGLIHLMMLLDWVTLSQTCVVHISTRL